ncbi:hypothetical protein [Halorubrum sp. Eb13]|uniref:hypothetical protein n=1 Tax=Halorubrum sp. Eb13 TaxID=1383843 RepID=UPI00113FD11B|nr:hypothetical protein [Halorubrum sp. Eb13]
MSKWTKISVVVTIILIGIPTAADFYPPLFAGVAEQLPLDMILTWMGRIGLVALGGLIGWYARGERDSEQDEDTTPESTDEDTTPETTDEVPDDVLETQPAEDDDETVQSIEGCIETGETCWRGTAELSDGELVETEVAYRAICPHCQTVMYDGENQSVGIATTATTYWDCPSCGHRTVEEYSKYEDAENLFNSHIQRITESRGEDYSFDNLIENIDGEVTPRRIWEQYAELADDQQVSTNCFH